MGRAELQDLLQVHACWITVGGSAPVLILWVAVVQEEIRLGASLRGAAPEVGSKAETGLNTMLMKEMSFREAEKESKKMKEVQDLIHDLCAVC